MRGRKTSPSGILWILALANTCLGLFLSTATAPKTITIVGADKSDLAAMSKAAQPLAKVPWIALAPHRAASTILVNPAIDTVQYRGNIFGRATATVTYRQAVLALQGAKDTYLDPTGTLFVRTLPEAEAKAIPWLVLPKLPQPRAGMVGDFEPGGVVAATRLVKEHVGQLDYLLEVDTEFVISLQVKEGARFVLGSSDKLVEKVKVLANLLADKKQRLDKSTTVNLAAPDRPTVTRKSIGSR